MMASILKFAGQPNPVPRSSRLRVRDTAPESAAVAENVWRRQVTISFGVAASDAEALATLWEYCPRADWLFELLDAGYTREYIPPGRDDRALRMFACRCVGSITKNPGPAFDVGLRLARGEIEASAAAQLARVMSGGACAATLSGISRCLPGAAAWLAVYATLDTDPRQAAWKASYNAARYETFTAATMAVRTSQVKVGPWGPTRSFLNAHPDFEEARLGAVYRKHAGWLREAICNPFSTSAERPS